MLDIWKLRKSCWTIAKMFKAPFMCYAEDPNSLKLVDWWVPAHSSSGSRRLSVI